MTILLRSRPLTAGITCVVALASVAVGIVGVPRTAHAAASGASKSSKSSASASSNRATQQSQSPPTVLAPGAWAARYTSATHTIVDSQGMAWLPATDLSGGTTVTSAGGIGNTGSPQLYLSTRVGATSWTVNVPSPGRYAVNLLIADTTMAGPRRHVFDVTETDGSSTNVLATAVDAAATVSGWHPLHVTGTVDVTSTTLRLTFTPRAGVALVSALEVTSDGVTGPRTASLTETFGGPAGTAPDSSIWSYQTGIGWEGSDGNENYTNSPANSALDGNGNLALTARRQYTRDSDGSANFTSARLVSNGKFSFGYGHVEATISTPAGSGLWPAFWAKGVNESQVDWPTCGEIDVMEGLGGKSQVVAGHVHSLGNSTDPVAYKNYPEASLGEDWTSGTTVTSTFHTYSIDYAPGYITFSMDGNPYFTAAPEDLTPGEAWPFNGSRFYLIMGLAIGNNSWTGLPTASWTAASMLVRRVLVTN